MAKIEHIHHRLERWALFVHGGRRMGSGSGMLAMFRGYVPDEPGQRQAAIPINEEECWETESAIKRLPSDLALTVSNYYLHDSSYTQRVLSISRSVLSQRIDRSHQLLDAMFVEAKVNSVTHREEPSWYKRSFTP